MFGFVKKTNDSDIFWGLGGFKTQQKVMKRKTPGDSSRDLFIPQLEAT